MHAEHHEGHDSEPCPSITSTFSARGIFITGVTGFLGRGLLSRILRMGSNWSNLPKIFVLVRSQRGQNADERLKTLLDDVDPVLSNRLRSSKGSALRKRVVAIPGDINSHSLGLSEEHRAIIQNHVSVFFHCAANIIFRRDIKDSFASNVVGLFRVVDLARGCRALAAFVHVSTAYTNGERAPIEERTYQDLHVPGLDALAKQLESLPNDIAADLYLGKKLNPYCWSKAVGESYLADLPSSFPLAILRPTILAPSIMDPVPGWVQGVHGPCTPIIAIGNGILKVVPFDPQGNADFLPVDRMINAMLQAGWWLCCRHEGHHTLDDSALLSAPWPPTFHVGMTAMNPLSMQDLLDGIVRHSRSMRFPNRQRQPSIALELSWKLPMRRLVSHYLWAIGADTWTWSNVARNTYGKLGVVVRDLQPICCVKEMFPAGHLRELDRISSVADDHHAFPTKNDWEWDEYIRIMVEGVRVFVAEPIAAQRAKAAIRPKL